MLWFQVQRSFYDPSHDHGFWSPSTSLANFCEEDYIVTPYIAEFINTLSNLAYVYYACYPPSALLPFFSERQQRSKDNLSFPRIVGQWTSWDAHAICLMLVGAASAAFHMTLRALPQWCDESSMYLLAGSWIYTLLTTAYYKTEAAAGHETRGKQSSFQIIHQNQWITGALLVAVLALASISSSWTGLLDIHSLMFGALLVASGIKMIYLIFVSTAGPDQWYSMTEARRTLLLSLLRALAFLVLAFSLWLLECNPSICPQLRYLRKQMDQMWYLRPLTMLTQLHGWWHVLTARAAGEYMMLVRLLTTDSVYNLARVHPSGHRTAQIHRSAP